MSNNKFKILIIEDDASIRRFVETLLHTNGYQVLTADTCRMGYSLSTSHNPDLIILDLGLPDEDGLAFIQKLREGAITPIIVCLLYTSDAADE